MFKHNCCDRSQAGIVFFLLWQGTALFGQLITSLSLYSLKVSFMFFNSQLPKKALLHFDGHHSTKWNSCPQMEICHFGNFCCIIWVAFIAKKNISIKKSRYHYRLVVPFECHLEQFDFGRAQQHHCCRCAVSFASKRIIFSI